MQRTFKWGLWFVFGTIVGIPAILTIYSSWKVFPDARFMALGLLAVTISGSAIFTFYASDMDDRSRHFSLVWKLLVAVCLCATVIVHFQVSREYSVAKGSMTERRVDEDRADKRREQVTQDLINLAKAQKDLTDAHAKATAAQAAADRAEARKLGMLPVHLRKPKEQTAPAATATNMASVTIPTPEASPSPASVDQAATAATPKLTPEEVLLSWSWWLWMIQALDTGCVMLGLAILSVLYKWDGNRNGIPDWIERLDLEEVRRRFPQFYNRMLANQQGQTTNP